MPNTSARPASALAWPILGSCLLAVAVGAAVVGTPLPAAAGSYFATLPPGSLLPGGPACGREVLASSTPWEPRPQNSTANHTRGSAAGAPAPADRRIDGASSAYNTRYARRLKGNFTG